MGTVELEAKCLDLPQRLLPNHVMFKLALTMITLIIKVRLPQISLILTYPYYIAEEGQHLELNFA